MKTLPKFSVLARNYPDKFSLPTKKLLDSIGGRLRDVVKDHDNTCAVRLSWCLNHSGAAIRKIPRLFQLEGAATPGTRSPLYLTRVSDVKGYMEAVYGPGKLIYDARKKPGSISLGGRKDVQGVVVFSWLGATRDFGARGHADLFEVVDARPVGGAQFAAACIGQCFWYGHKAPMLAYLWETTR